MGAARDITIALLEGMARRVGEELADRGIGRLRKRQGTSPKTEAPAETSPSERPSEKGP